MSVAFVCRRKIREKWGRKTETLFAIGATFIECVMVFLYSQAASLYVCALAFL